MTHKLPHILIVTSWYPSIERPTYGSFVQEQVQLLQKKGHQVTVLHPELSGTFLHTFSKKVVTSTVQIEDDITVIRVKTKPLLPRTRPLAYSILCRYSFKEIKRILGNNLPDIIHSHSMFMGGVVGQFLSKKFEIPHIHTEHSSSLISGVGKFTNHDVKSIRDTLESAKVCIFVSRFFKEQIINKFGVKAERFIVIPNLINNIFFSSDISSRKYPKKVICIGGLSAVKNHELLLRAWERVLKSHPEMKLSLVGSGPLESELKQLADQLTISSSVTFIPGSSRQEIRDQINEHDIVVSSSKIETFGLSIAEALACGKPVVATNSGGVSDIIQTSDGIIASQDMDSLSEGIIHLIENYSSFLPEQLRSSAFDRFHEDQIYQQLFSVYSDLLKDEKSFVN